MRFQKSVARSRPGVHVVPATGHAVPDAFPAGCNNTPREQQIEG